VSSAASFIKTAKITTEIQQVIGDTLKLYILITELDYRVVFCTMVATAVTKKPLLNFEV